MTILRINWRNDIRMIEIKVLQAHQGDCIWVRCISEKTVNIVIDAGTSTFKKGFRNLVKEINNKKERIDLLVFSHIDDDHIKGCIQYLQEKGEKIIDKVWINGSGSRVYSDMQEHSVNNVSNLVTLIMEKNIPIETPILEGKEFVFCGGRIKVIGPTENEMLKVATKIEHSNQVTEHAGYKYVGNIIDVQDKYQPDLSDSNKASIIMVVEFENKKLLFTGDSTSENIIKAVDKYYPGDEFEVVKLPHHGSPRNISRELIRRLSTNKFIISTNKALEKVVLFRFAEERKTTELLCNYEWWATGYFTEDDIKKYFDTNRIVMRYIGEEKIIL